MRKRVFTKNPVRENRTPGSVRGLSGNWQSYRDLGGEEQCAGAELNWIRGSYNVRTYQSSWAMYLRTDLMEATA